MEDITEIICCPRCRSRLYRRDTGNTGQVFCTNSECKYAQDGFLEISGQPVLIDFDNSILSKEDFRRRGGASNITRDDSRGSTKTRVLQILFGINQVARDNCFKFLERLKSRVKCPRILIVGGGARGSGIDALYADGSIELVGTDIYASPYTKILADGHRLPFLNECFDGVWIQAVLEHVLDPPCVVAEIHRVLKPDGLVFADTPFMQQVHEGAYDFTRYTLSGHRWLFRNFALLDAGASAGAGTAFIWSVKYLVRSLTGSNRFATFVSMLFFWARFLDRLAKSRPNADAASGVFFLGSKAAAAIDPHDMIEFYEKQLNLKSEVG